jgi:hypothetical protein
MINDVVFFFIDELELKGFVKSLRQSVRRFKSAGVYFGSVKLRGGAEFLDADAADRQFPADKKGERRKTLFVSQFS